MIITIAELWRGLTESMAQLTLMEGVHELFPVTIMDLSPPVITQSIIVLIPLVASFHLSKLKPLFQSFMIAMCVAILCFNIFLPFYKFDTTSHLLPWSNYLLFESFLFITAWLFISISYFQIVRALGKTNFNVTVEH